TSPVSAKDLLQALSDHYDPPTYTIAMENELHYNVTLLTFNENVVSTNGSDTIEYTAEVRTSNGTETDVLDAFVGVLTRRLSIKSDRLQTSTSTRSGGTIIVATVIILGTILSILFRLTF